MLSAVINLGLQSIEQIAVVAKQRRIQEARHPLAAYPCLHHLIVDAERRGVLAAERRRVMHRLAA